jgi:hypothetical protein
MLTQRRLVLDHLLKFKTISSWEAIQEYGITRLACFINMLRNENKNITDEWVEKNGKRFKVYSFNPGGNV